MIVTRARFDAMERDRDFYRTRYYGLLESLKTTNPLTLPTGPVSLQTTTGNGPIPGVAGPLPPGVLGVLNTLAPKGPLRTTLEAQAREMLAAGQREDEVARIIERGEEVE